MRLFFDLERADSTRCGNGEILRVAAIFELALQVFVSLDLKQLSSQSDRASCLVVDAAEAQCSDERLQRLVDRHEWHILLAEGTLRMLQLPATARAHHLAHA